MHTSLPLCLEYPISFCASRLKGLFKKASLMFCQLPTFSLPLLPPRGVDSPPPQFCVQTSPTFLLMCLTHRFGPVRFLSLEDILQFISESFMPSTAHIWYKAGSPQCMLKGIQQNWMTKTMAYGQPKFLGQTGKNLTQACFQFFNLASYALLDYSSQNN